MSTLPAMLRLVRLLNVVMVAMGAALGALLVAGAAAFEGGALVRTLLAAVAAALLAAGGNAFNDAADVEIDRINRPGRPVPSGRVSVAGAQRLWAGLTAAGVALAFVLSAAHGLVAVGAAGLLVLYSLRLKRAPLAGNVAVAALIGTVLVFGGLVVGPPLAAFVGAAFAFLTTLAREVAKDVEDERGDAALHARTLPLVWGRTRSVRLAQGVVVLAVAGLPFPYFSFGFAPLYLLVALGAGAALLAAFVALQAATPDGAGHASRALKWAMLAGMAALAVG